MIFLDKINITPNKLPIYYLLFKYLYIYIDIYKIHL